MFKLLRVVLAFVFAFAAFVPAQTAAISSPQTAPAAPQTDASGVSEIALGSQHTCAVVDGGVKCWGNNQYGQLGDGTNQNRSTPVDVAGLGAASGVKHIWAGEYFTCAIIDANSDGLSSVKCWGRNDSGQLGDGTFTTRNTPAFVTGSESGAWNITSYSGASSHSCVKLGNDPFVTQGLLCWGANQSSQLGDGASINSNHPVTATNLLDMPDPGGVAQVVTGKSFTCALGYSSSAFQCLGANQSGQLGDGTTTPSILGVLTHKNDYLNPDLTGLSANGSHICAFNYEQRADTYVSGLMCWGANEYGQAGIGNTQNVLTPTSVYTYIQNMPQNVLAVGEFHTCVYNSVYDDPRWSHTTYKSGLNCWGRNDYGQLGDGTTTSRSTPANTLLENEYAREVKAGGYHTCMLTSARNVLCWGRNDSGQLGDGTVEHRSSPVQVLGLPNSGGVSEIALGGQHTCAVVDGGVKCWGNNEYGQLGDGTNQNRSMPVDVLSIGPGKGVKHIWAGEYFTCAIIDTTDDGLSSVKCWGRNDSGQLGDGTFITRNTPAFVVGSESEAWQIGSYSGVGSHSCVGLGDVDTTRAVLCWGQNTTYQLGDGTSASSNHPVTSTYLLNMAYPNAFKLATGGAFSCAQWDRMFRDIRCVGVNGAGQLGNGTTTASITGTWVSIPDPYADYTLSDFAANGSHACFVEQETHQGPFAVYCWGFNGYGQVGIGTTQNVLTPTQVVLPSNGIRANLAMGEFHTCNYTPVSWYDPHFPPFASASGLRCWGRNDYGQLGDGSTTTRLSPVLTPLAGQRFRQVAAGGYHTCALTDDLHVLCWGRNDSGQLGDGTLTQRILPIIVSGFTPITKTTIVVTSFDDGNFSACTLRNALLAAANHWSWHDCPPALGRVTIKLPAGVYTNTHGSGAYGSGALVANADVTIIGEGADKTILTVDPSIRDRVLFVAGAGVTLSDVTIRGGQSPTDTQKGGGIRSTGSLAIINSLITQNSDGGIASERWLIIWNTAIVQNNDVGLILSGEGGVVVNATFSGNPQNIQNAGALLLNNVTLNSPAEPGTTSIATSGQVNSRDTLITGMGSCAVSGAGAITSLGHNLVNAPGCQTYFAADGDLIGVDPRLGPIKLNAPGQTPTHALLPGSPAIDAGGSLASATDQRGVTRPQGSASDIGAYEYRPIADAPARVYLPRLTK